ncbi:MAG TPA: glycosyltransferase family 39 protein [Chthoniobacterales bacterium]|nr:glycosyltransferase family 39 protein [Chthoniobacterales bacterium]
MNKTRAVWLFIAALTLVRLSMLGSTDLEFDEAHYWMWSERLAPGYFSKGPGIAFAIRASTAIFGPTEFGVRFWSPILAAGTSLLLFYFGKRLFNESVGLWTVIAFNVTPIFNVGAFVMTTDALSISFWMAAMFTFWLAVEKSPRFSFWWPVTGLLIGLGFLGRFTNAFEIVCILLVLAFAPRLRQEFKRPGLYLLIAIFAICTIPPIVWNAQHAWVTTTHLRTRGGLAENVGFRPLEPLKFFGEHFIFYSPLLFAALTLAVLGSWRRVNQQFKVLFLFWFGLPVFVFYFLLSLNHVATPNWDAVSFLSLGLLAVFYWSERIEARGVRVFALSALLLGFLISIFSLDSDLLRTVGIRFFRSDPSDRLRGWKPMVAEVERIRNEEEAKLGEKLFLIADERHRASELAFYLKDKRIEGPGHPPAYIIESQDLVNQFSFWPRYDQFVEAPTNPNQPSEDAFTEQKGVNPFVGRSALLIRNFGKNPPHNIRAAFESTEPVGTIELRRFGRHVRYWQIFLCRHYRTLPL